MLPSEGCRRARGRRVCNFLSSARTAWPPPSCSAASYVGRNAGAGCSREILPGPCGGAIELANADCLQNLRFEVCRIYGYGAAAPLFSVLVVRDAAAGLAAKVGANPAAPGVTGQTPAWRLNLHRAGRVVRPECAVAAADRAIAAGHGARCSPNVDANQAAVTNSAERRWRGLFSACGWARSAELRRIRRAREHHPSWRPRRDSPACHGRSKRGLNGAEVYAGVVFLSDGHSANAR